MRVRAVTLLAFGLLSVSPSIRDARAADLRVKAVEPAWLGVAMEAATQGGVAVRHVVRSSPAQKAGLRDGDRIVRVEATAVGNAAEVTRAIVGRGVGESVTVAVEREGKELELHATLEPRPSPTEVLRMDHVGAFAPAWAGTTPLGAAPHGLDELRGRVVVLDFWATWCGACRQMAPRLSALQARYGAQGLTVVGITADEAQAAAAFVQRTGMRYGSLVDPRGETARAYGITGLPTYFVIDKRGVVRSVEVGFDPDGGGELEQTIRQLLGERGP